MRIISINSNPEPLDENWVRIDPDNAAVAEPSDEDLKIFRARQLWLSTR
jgi:hypothetical protein